MLIALPSVIIFIAFCVFFIAITWWMRILFRSTGVALSYSKDWNSERI